MSQTKIIFYQSLPARIGILLCNFTIPLWGILAPTLAAAAALLSIILLFGVFFIPGEFQTIPLITISGSCFYLTMLFFIGTMLKGSLQDNKILVSEDGLTVPVLTSLSNKMRRFIEWREIKSIALTGELDHIDSLNLHILLEQGKICLGLRGMSSNDIEYLLVSMSNWLPAPAQDMRLQELKESLWNSDNLEPAESLSFTKMWEDELNDRFSATAYIPLSPNQKLLDGNIKVIKQIAFGGWSAVYLVQESNTKLKVLKECVLPPLANNELKLKAEAMFSREAHLLMKLDHPKIVRVYEHFKHDNRQYLLLDYVSGQNLRQMVRLQGPLHQLDVLDYAEQMADILVYLHLLEPPMVHRDLTPDNIVVNVDKVMLIDFGAANEIIGTATGTLIGKQGYIAPEQFRGHATTSSDLYALGATIHFMLCGREPEALCRSSPKDFVIVSDVLDQLVQTLTEQDQSKRPESAKAVKEQIVAIRQGWQWQLR